MQGVEEVQREVKAQQGELAVRNVKMVDEEVEARLLRMRENILEQQNRQLLEANQKMASEMVVLCDLPWNGMFYLLNVFSFFPGNGNVEIRF